VASACTVDTTNAAVRAGAKALSVDQQCLFSAKFNALAIPADDDNVMPVNGTPTEGDDSKNALGLGELEIGLIAAGAALLLWRRRGEERRKVEWPTCKANQLLRIAFTSL
jgi:hypothetical protein